MAPPYPYQTPIIPTSSFLTLKTCTFILWAVYFNKSHYVTIGLEMLIGADEVISGYTIEGSDSSFPETTNRR